MVAIRKEMRQRSRPESRKHRTTGKTSAADAVQANADHMAEMALFLKERGIDVTNPPTGTATPPNATDIAEFVLRSEQAVQQAAAPVPADRPTVRARIRGWSGRTWGRVRGFFRRGDK